MPKLYEYLGIVVYFYTNEHDPIHVHGQCDGRESKAEIILENGRVVRIVVGVVAGKRSLEGQKLRVAGVVFVLGLYFLLLMQIVQNAQTAADRAGMYICMGVATLLLFHLLVNVGMVVGSMPVTGIPLPLMSSGGSNMVSIFMMLGLVNNVRLRRFVN